ncbi:MAG: S8 family peptidase [Parcubacteria group bacterium]|nr:S8 family peptidase [Parcubacteria group bacterium]
MRSLLSILLSGIILPGLLLRAPSDAPAVIIADLSPSSGEETIQREDPSWGLMAIKGDLVQALGRSGAGVKIGIIDTGIDLDHSDLAFNIKGGVNLIHPEESFTDDNGHGTHVAGIIGALDNNEGTVGVAPEVSLYAIKVLGADGTGTLEDIIEGIRWATENGMNVINMSVVTLQDTYEFHEAIRAAFDAGIVIVAAAGNSGGDVFFPAAYDEVIAVSALDTTNARADFSSHGPAIDLAAPGVGILSTFKGSGYLELTGTSMAAPYVAGVAALLLATPVGSGDLDGNGAWDPNEVEARLEKTATDLGDAGVDTLYGAGLVNAFAAVQ